MKQKVFTLLTLALLVCSGAWAAEVEIFSAVATTAWSVPASTSNADVSAKATIVGGKMTVYNGQGSAKDLIVTNADKMSFSQTNGNTMFKVTLPTALAVGDVITVDVYSNKAERGIWLTTSEAYPSSGGKKINTTVNSAKAWNNGLTYTLKAADEDLVGQTSFYIHRATGNTTFFANFKISRDISAPYIWTQPVGAAYTTEDPIEALSVAAIASTGVLSYQWYSCDDALKTNASAIAEKTEKSYTPTSGGFYFCRVTDGNGSTDSNVAEISIEAASAPSKPVITADPGTTVSKGTAVTLTAASASGLPAPTYEWFQCDDAEKTNPVSKATTASYSPSTATAGTYYFYAVASNSEGDATSDVVTLTVNPSNACQLISVKFSNSAYGAITEPVADPAANGTVTVPYLAGQAAPTVVDASVEISADATYSIAGNVLTVTAEDGTTTAAYDITKTAFTPLAVPGDISTTTFDAVPSWIYCPYGFDASKGVKIAKNYNETSNMRITKGNTRMYIFVAAAKKITLTSGSGGDKDIKVYRNGIELNSPTKSGSSGSTKEIVLDTTSPCMIMIENKSGSGGGDAGFTKYAVTAAKGEPSNPVVSGSTVTLNTTANMNGWRSYNNNTSNKYTVSANTKVYYASATGDSKVTLTEIDGGVPANTAVILHKTDAAGAAAEIVLTETATDITAPVSNELQVSTAGQNLGKVYRLGYKSTDGVGFYTYTTTSAPEGIIYVSSVSGANFLSLDFGEGEGDVTSISEIEKMRDGKNEAFFNLAGQRVAQPTKGLYIVNGKKVLVK